MRISFVIPFFPNTANGGCKVIFEYANYLVNKGNEVTLYMTGSEAFLNRYPIPGFLKKIAQKYIVEKKRISWFLLDSRIKRISVNKFCDDTMKDADIVFATAVETAEDVAGLSISKGKKCYLIQGFENWRLSEEAVYNTYKLGMNHFVVSGWLKEIVDEYSMKPSVLLSNSIDTEIFNAITPGEDRIRHSIVFHYRKAVHKGGIYALQSIQILKEKYPDLEVYIVCNEKNVDNLPEYCQVKYNITAQEIAAINNRVQVFMCSSVEEGFGLPGLEAMACGCALVTTNYKGALEYAVDGVNALISEIMNPEAMAENVIRLFEDEELRERLAQAGVCTARERSLEKTGAILEKTLRNIILEK